MSNIWFTSDLHICHDRDFVWKARNFENVAEMNEAIVEKWNKLVKPDDTVWNLGDIALMDTDTAIEILKQLNGTQYWLRGNHDHGGRVRAICEACPNIIVPKHTFVTTLQIGNNLAYLGHYPMLTANNDEDKPFNRHVLSLHGHTHQKDNFKDENNPFMYHVGVDSHNCEPVNEDEVISDIRKQWESLK